MTLRLHAYAAASIAVFLAGQARAENHDIREVFHEFEALCFDYAANGYNLDLELLIEKAGFKFVQKAHDGSSIYNGEAIQLVIGEKACAFGMPQLPFPQMAEWTAQWADIQKLVEAMELPSTAGPRYRLWSGMGFDIRLQEDKFPDGTPLTGLILTRR